MTPCASFCRVLSSSPQVLCVATASMPIAAASCGMFLLSCGFAKCPLRIFSVSRCIPADNSESAHMLRLSMIGLGCHSGFFGGGVVRRFTKFQLAVVHCH